jgi:[ribosomal protein S18]-alanine N-acetyltransferase
MKVAGLQVRAANAADLAEVIALERGAAEAPHWAEGEYVAILQVRGEGEGAGAVRRCLFVAEVDGKLLGFAVGKVILPAADGVGEIESVAVSDTARRRGVGRALCEAVVGWCREQGVGEIELEVRAGSEGAIALYAGLGFVAVGRRGGYYRDPDEDAVLMQLRLGRGK